MQKEFHGYIVDSSGFVLSAKNRYKMAFTTNDKGYKSVGLVIDGKQRFIKVHRLIAHCWLGLDLNSGLQVHHLDVDPGNNDLFNLEVVSKSYHNHLTNKVRYTLDNDLVKQCRVCGQVKERKHFYLLTSPNAYERNSSWCRACSCNPK